MPHSHRAARSRVPAGHRPHGAPVTAELRVSAPRRRSAGSLFPQGTARAPGAAKVQSCPNSRHCVPRLRPHRSSLLSGLIYSECSAVCLYKSVNIDLYKKNVRSCSPLFTHGGITVGLLRPSAVLVVSGRRIKSLLLNQIKLLFLRID